ncbi:hypothetical protein F5Y18DRAFT_210161 [Xylariaceae sp. FL1019]|nr:hypothetical protein F5Y18DRAFT_210161 [Xylariaceae sp. FL1019]
MKTTSFIALLFLPPTFTSAIFSTSFFSFGDDENGWRVSTKFWWYWVVVVPVTLLSVLVWYQVFIRRAPVYGLDPTIGSRIDAELNDLRKQDGLV